MYHFKQHQHSNNRNGREITKYIVIRSSISSHLLSFSLTFFLIYFSLTFSFFTINETAMGLMPVLKGRKFIYLFVFNKLYSLNKLKIK